MTVQSQEREKKGPFGSLGSNDSAPIKQIEKSGCIGQIEGGKKS